VSSVDTVSDWPNSLARLFSRVVNFFRTGFAEGILILILLAFFVIFSFASPSFLTVNNLWNLVRQVPIIGVVSIGMTIVIISAGIDLSVGSIVGFSNILVAVLMTHGVPIIPSILITFAAGSVLGVINGVLIHDGRVPPFIATLGMMTAVRGLLMLISGARMVAGLPRPFLNFAQINILWMPSLFFVWLVVIALSVVMTTVTRFGRNVFALGSNPEAARLSGINIRATLYGVYAFSALTSSIAGILYTSRLANGIPTAGEGYELDAIAAAVVGGASLMGGEGTILGTVLGALIIATLRNGGDLLGINPFILQIAIGVLIVAAVLIDQLTKRKIA
jgi:ribose/xylose/arabinose/galactoside ABC-type transport system permease subunit